MPIDIPEKIDSEEILVKFIFDRDFHKKNINSQRLDGGGKNIFLPNKGGVSLQRAHYCSLQKCKDFAKKITSNNRIFAGFVALKKASFDDTLNKFIKQEEISETFSAEIEHTPLDDEFNYLPKDHRVNVNSDGNPSHSDLIYKNPKPNTDDPITNTAIRSFSRKLIKLCQVIIDENNLGDSYDGKKMEDFFS